MSTIKPHPGRQPAQVWTCSCSVPGKEVPRSGVPGSSQKAQQHSLSPLLSPATSTAAGVGVRGLAEGDSSSLPTPDKLIYLPNKRLQSHQPIRPRLPPRAVTVQQPCYHCSSATLLRTMSGDLSPPCPRDNGSVGRENVRESSERACKEAHCTSVLL